MALFSRIGSRRSWKIGGNSRWITWNVDSTRGTVATEESKNCQRRICREATCHSIGNRVTTFIFSTGRSNPSRVRFLATLHTRKEGTSAMIAVISPLCFKTYKTNFLCPTANIRPCENTDLITPSGKWINSPLGSQFFSIPHAGSFQHLAQDQTSSPAERFPRLAGL